MRALFLTVAIATLLAAGGARAQVSNEPSVIPNSGHSGVFIESLAFPRNGQWLASGSDDSTIKLWDVTSGRLLRTLRGHSRKIDAIALTPDGRSVVSLSEDSTIKIWEAETGRLVRTITGLIDASSDALGRSLALSNDGRSGYISSFNAIRRFDLNSGSLQQKYPKPGTFASWQFFALSPDNKLIAGAHNGAVNAPLKYSAIGSQVKLLDAASGRVIRTLGTYSDAESVTTISFSPDGRLVAAGGNEGTVKVWDVESGRLLYTLTHSETQQSRYIDQVRFSPDSRTIATAGGREGIKIWDALTGRIARTMTGKAYEWSHAIEYSPDGRLLVTGSSSQIKLTDTMTGSPSQISFGQSDTSAISIVPFAPGRWLEFGTKGFSVWDETSGQIVQSQDAEPGYVIGSQQFWARDTAGHVLVAANGKNLNINIWDVTQGSLLRSITWTPAPQGDSPCPTCAKYSLQNISLSPDARWVAAYLWGDPTSGIRIWNVATGQQVRVFSTGVPSRGAYGVASYNAANSIVFSPDSHSLAAGMYDGNFKNWLKVWDVESGRQTSAFVLPDHYDQPNVGKVETTSVTFAPDGRSVVLKYVFVPRQGSLDANYSIVTLDSTGGQLLRRFVPDKLYSYSPIIRYSPDGRLIFVGISNSDLINVWDAASGQLVRTLQGNPGTASSIEFFSDGRRVIIGNNNGTASIWSMDNFEQLAIILHTGAGEWVTITPEGFFTASAHGAELLHVVQGFRTTGIDQVYQSLYRPDLVREKLAGDPRGLVREAAARLDLSKVLASGDAPSARLLSPADGVTADTGQVNVEVEVGDRGGGVGRVEWRVNGLTIGLDNPGTVTAGQPLRLTRSLALDTGSNAIEVVAYNRANLIASVPARINVTLQVPGAPAPVAAAKPRLFVLAAGSDNYADARFRLRYSVPDAKAMAQALADSGKELYRSVEVAFLSDSDVTREKLDATFTELAKTIEPTDVFVMYLAGHGKTVDGRYYFVPQPFKIDGALSKSTIDAAVAQQGIAQDQWQRWFAQLPARKSLVLFDTCESGTIAKDEQETKDLERTAANDRLAQATGRSIITASSGSTEAFEGYHGHGLFTYNLLDAFDRADSDKNGTIEVTELAAYVYAEVTAISEREYKQRQEPQMKITLNYPLIRQANVLHDDALPTASNNGPTVQLAHTAELQIKPANGATVVRSLSAQTPVTIVKSEGGWSLIASEGKPLGYVATRDLAVAQ